jgi:hypothetical protein
MATDFKNLIDINGLTTFKQEADKLYETKANVTTLAGRVTTLENDDSAANTIEIVKVNGAALTPDAQKAVDVTVPTAVTDLSDAADYAKVADVPTKLSDLTNDNNTVTDSAYVHTDNNFTSALLTKLNGIAEGAAVNVIEKVMVNGTEQTITGKAVDIAVVEGTANGTIKVAGTDVAVHGLGTAAFADADDLGEDNVIEVVKVNNVALTPDANKAVNVTVPTTVASLTDAANYALKSQLGTAAAANTEGTLTNGSNLPTGAAVKAFVEGKGYQTAADVAGILSDGDYATESYVNTAIGNANHLQATKVATLPATGQANVLYLVPDDGGKSNKDMYIWDATGSKFVLVGNTEVDLTGYAQESQFSVATTAQVQALFA